MNIKSSFVALAGAALACTSPLVHAGLPGSISGPWYNPQQSGHGLSITLVTADKAVVIWHVSDHDGKPLTLYIEGDISGRRIDGEAYAPEGMRFGEFDRNDVQLPHWGSVDIEFDDCGHANLSWEADDLSYGSGDMSIRRLGAIEDIQCTLPPRNSLPSGLYEGAVPNGLNFEIYLQGVVDEQGTFWGMYRRYNADGPVGEISTDSWHMDRTPNSLVARPVRINENGVIESIAHVKKLSWKSAPRSSWGSSVSELAWTPEDDSPDVFESNLGSGFDGTSFKLTKGSRKATQIAPLQMSRIAGRTYSIPLQNQFFQTAAPMTIDDQGSACIDPTTPGMQCRFTGKVSIRSEELGLINFEIRPAPTATVLDTTPAFKFKGVGWLADTDHGREIVLIGGPESEAGFGLVGVKWN